MNRQSSINNFNSLINDVNETKTVLPVTNKIEQKGYRD